VVLNSKSSSNIQIARTHTINHCDLEDAVLRDDAGVNSPHNEMKLED
jgi:RNA polymerase II subunit A small phosphatase-like protein